MKNKTLGIVYLLTIVTGLLIFAGCQHQERSTDGSDDKSNKGKGKHGIILKKDISNDKWTRIVAILNGPTQTPDASPRTMLFRIKNYSPGAEPTEIGQLDEDMLQDDFPVDSNFKGHAVQIGLGLAPDFHRYPKAGENASTPPLAEPQPSATPPTSHAHLQQNLKESALMVKAVDDILKETSPPSPTP